ncbi:hypothetical protein KH5_02570 [Urechidicola sp. KH5]
MILLDFRTNASKKNPLKFEYDNLSKSTSLVKNGLTNFCEKFYEYDKNDILMKKIQRKLSKRILNLSKNRNH